MRLKVEIREEGGVTVVALHGRLTMDYGSKLHDQVKSLVEGGAKRLLVDLAAVDYIDSYGIGQMVACYTTARREGGQLRYVGLRDKIRRLLEMTTIPTILEFDTDLATGMKNLAGS